MSRTGRNWTRHAALAASLMTLAAAGAGSAQAQWWGWGGYHSSTPFEGAARGVADLTRSRGEANLYNSEAAINFEQARSANFDNRLKYAQTYFERRRLHDEYMEKQQTEGRYDREMLSQRKPLDPLTVAELDPRTGRISWPDTLLTEELAGSRDRFEELAAQRSRDGYLDFQLRNAVRRETKTMMDELRDQVASYTADDYADARRFVERLAHGLNTLPRPAVAQAPAGTSRPALLALAMDDADRLVARD